MSERVNVVYINSHDTGRYIQPYGHAVATPNLQKLAEDGVLFRQSFCCNPTCSASRSGLVTGQYAHSNGMIGLAHRGISLNDNREHLLHTLRAAGYHTTLAGGQHVSPDPHALGYDKVFDELGKGDANAVEFLQHPPSQPFYLEVGFGQTHRKYPDSTGQVNPAYCLPPAPFPDTPELRKEMADFKLCAQTLDERMGRVFASLEANGLAGNTLVICTTDHGIAFPRMKCHLTDSGIAIFLIMRGPGGFRGGKVLDGLVSHVDIFPTLCEYLGIEPPGWLQGHSFMPLVRGERDEIRDEIFAEVNLHAAYEPKRCVRTRRYKYIRRYDGRDKVVLPNCDDSVTKKFWIEHGWAEQELAEEALYDLYFDPVETHNLAADPARAEVLADMRARLARWMESTDDPLLKGPLAIPPGAMLNDVDGLSPQEATR